jgi:hypothetical protein
LTGCGGCQRKSPTGGAAKGTPLKILSEESALTVPSRMPLAVLTRSAAEAVLARIATLIRTLLAITRLQLIMGFSV